MCAAVHKHFLHASVGKELKRVFDERGIRERQQALRSSQHAAVAWPDGTDSRALQCEGVKTRLERVCKYLNSQPKLGSKLTSRLTTACSGSSRSSSLGLPFSWPFLPLGGMACTSWQWRKKGTGRWLDSRCVHVVGVELDRANHRFAWATLTHDSQ